MNRKSVITGGLVLFLLLNVTLYPVAGFYQVELTDGVQTEEVPPGDIIDVTFSDLYPTLGEPVDIIITIIGNPLGFRFDEKFTVYDEFEGLIATSSGICWETGNVTIENKTITIGRLPVYREKISWYPTIVGNHSLYFVAGSYLPYVKNVSVSFDSNAIIFPSSGYPSIVNKNQSEKLIVALSEERTASEDPLALKDARLESIDNDSIYELTNPEHIFSTSLFVGENVFEDELIISYNISSIPCSFYDLAVTTDRNQYQWVHAVQIIEQESSEYVFVQLTDLHIGKVHNTIYETRKSIQLIQYINEEIQPDFIVMTGDCIDWYNEQSIRNPFQMVQEIILTSNSPIFITPGNHERYAHRLLFLYMPYYDLSPYHRYLNPLNDYSFEYGGIHFVCLDSGYDFSRWEIKPRFWNPTPEGSGLTDTQLYLIENELGNSSLRQIFLMHHPAVNDIEDRGLFSVPNNLPSGNEDCIAFNRGSFIQYCRSNNVALVISGHSHENKVLDYLGETPADSSAWPLFIQTPSSTLSKGDSGIRIVKIKDGNVQSYDCVPFDDTEYFT